MNINMSNYPKSLNYLSEIYVEDKKEESHTFFKQILKDIKIKNNFFKEKDNLTVG